MLELFSSLEWKDILLSACLAYIIFSVIRTIRRIREIKHSGAFISKNMSIADANAKCRELFPIEEITFKGQAFTRGMKVKIITIQQKSFEGELIGVNTLNLICISNQNKMFAHRLEKVREISLVEPNNKREKL